VGKLYVSAQAQTSVDGVREELDQAQRLLDGLEQDGRQPIQLLHRLDRVREGLQKLESQGADLRVERTRFETLLQQVRRQRRSIVRSCRSSIEVERAEVEPEASRWWWFLDQTVARERREAWVRRIGRGVALMALLAAAWLAYQRFLAPPPEVRQAYRHIESGKAAVDEGDYAAAAVDFELARELTPENPEPWLWGGVLCERTAGCTEADSLFEPARTLYPSRFDFFLNRGRVYLESGDPDQARADVDTAIELNPSSGWGYYLRAGVNVRRADYAEALDDLQLAADLAEQHGQSRLHGMAVTQRAQLLRMHPPDRLD
jgi:tetratricopeptide (TPR) repeat protein